MNALLSRTNFIVRVATLWHIFQTTFEYCAEMTQSGSLMSDDHEDGKWAVGEDFQIPTVIPMSSYQAGKAIVRQGMEHKTMMLEVRTYLIVEFFLIFSYALGNIPSWAY